MDKLLELLSENAKLTAEQLAVMLNLTTQQVSEKIEQYEKDGIIIGYKTLINWEKVDKSKAIALIGLRVTPKQDNGFDEIAGRIMQFDEVESVYLMSGGYDLTVKVCGKSMQDIAAFVMRRLAPLDSVLSTATHFILTRYKDGGVILNKDKEQDERRSVLCD
jgi:DNA-binding Lrp family transcriptional regulator